MSTNALFLTFLLLWTTASAEMKVRIPAALPQEPPTSIQMFPGQTCTFELVLPASSDEITLASSVFIKTDALLAPLDIQGPNWEKVNTEAGGTLFQGKWTVPTGEKPLTYLLQVPAENVPASFRPSFEVHVVPRMLATTIQQIEQQFVIWVDPALKSFVAWLENHEIPFELLSPQVMEFREGDLLFAQLPPEGRERDQELESLKNCPVQFWFAHSESGSAILTQTDRMRQRLVMLELPATPSFPLLRPETESMLLRGLTFLINPDPQTP